MELLSSAYSFGLDVACKVQGQSIGRSGAAGADLQTSETDSMTPGSLRALCQLPTIGVVTPFSGQPNGELEKDRQLCVALRALAVTCQEVGTMSW